MFFFTFLDLREGVDAVDLEPAYIRDHQHSEELIADLLLHGERLMLCTDYTEEIFFVSTLKSPKTAKFSMLSLFLMKLY